MANVLKMMKQVKQVKKMQKELARKTVEVKSPCGSVTVVAKGDMSLKSISIEADLLDPSRRERVQKLLVSTVNSALDSSKKAAANDMQRLTGGMGLGDLFG